MIYLVALESLGVQGGGRNALVEANATKQFVFKDTEVADAGDQWRIQDFCEGDADETRYSLPSGEGIPPPHWGRGLGRGLCHLFRQF